MGFQKGHKYTPKNKKCNECSQFISKNNIQ